MAGMGVTRLNHAVLYVSQLDRSVEFYTTVLGFRNLSTGGGMRGAAFLQAGDSTNDHDLGLFELGAGASPSPAGRGGAVGLYHLAWEVDTLDELVAVSQRLVEANALVGATDHGTTKSLYGKDPDGIEFEVVWLIPADLITEADRSARMRVLDLPKEIARFGGQTRGGIGISFPRLPADATS